MNESTPDVGLRVRLNRASGNIIGSIAFASASIASFAAGNISNNRSVEALTYFSAIINALATVVKIDHSVNDFNSPNREETQALMTSQIVAGEKGKEHKYVFSLNSVQEAFKRKGYFIIETEDALNIVNKDELAKGQKPFKVEKWDEKTKAKFANLLDKLANEESIISKKELREVLREANTVTLENSTKGLTDVQRQNVENAVGGKVREV